MKTGNFNNIMALPTVVRNDSSMEKQMERQRGEILNNFEGFLYDIFVRNSSFLRGHKPLCRTARRQRSRITVNTERVITSVNKYFYVLDNIFDSFF